MGLKIFLNVFAHFLSKSDGREIFLFLLMHDFRTKIVHLVIWKKITPGLQWILWSNFSITSFYKAQEKWAATPTLLYKLIHGKQMHGVAINF